MAQSKRKKMLDILANDVQEDVEADTAAAGVDTKKVMQGRHTTLDRIASGKQEVVRRLKHAPERVRIWSEHDRDYSQLSPSSCEDLIDGFKRVGRQEFAAIVRALPDNDPDRANSDYELISGARRHWTAAHLGWDLVVEVRDLTDKQAFQLLDLENRNREDVSDHERAANYKRALPKYYGNKRTLMAKELDIDPGNFNKLLDLADLPSWLVEAYGDKRELKVHHGAAYKRLIQDSAAKKRMNIAAKKLTGSNTSGKLVFKTLKEAGKPPKPVAKRSTRPNYGRIQVEEGANGSIRLVLPGIGKLSGEQRDSLTDSFTAFLSDYLK